MFPLYISSAGKGGEDDREGIVGVGEDDREGIVGVGEDDRERV